MYTENTIKPILLHAHEASRVSAYTISREPKMCVCFHCLKLFHSSECDLEHIPQNGAAICPYCLMDSILPLSDEYPTTSQFLLEIHEAFFSVPEKESSFDPTHFLNDAKHLTRKDTRRILNIIARQGCKYCIFASECPACTGNPPEDFVCGFEVSTVALQKALAAGVGSLETQTKC